METTLLRLQLTRAAQSSTRTISEPTPWIATAPARFSPRLAEAPSNLWSWTGAEKRTPFTRILPREFFSWLWRGNSFRVTSTSADVRAAQQGGGSAQDGISA